MEREVMTFGLVGSGYGYGDGDGDGDGNGYSNGDGDFKSYAPLHF